ncbi:MAG: DNA-deoxyinosine glycosylase [Tenericutes bacterium]|jgi:TDG/mug DNA glycosylase family protein|nr:DNA-deoxyinosine glycosylase [Mycoplasmatota bacterium]
MKEIRVTHQFGPIYDKESKVLILGSFPSVKSRDNDFYYMHPQNRFWKILEQIYSDNFTSPNVDEKKNLLKKHHIALYDVIESCTIQGSSDSSIKDVQIADIQNIIDTSSVQSIYLNGRKAESIFLDQFADLKKFATYLPSTSPANARYSLVDLLGVWKKIK